MQAYNLSATFCLKRFGGKGKLYAHERRNAGLPGCDDRAAQRRDLDGISQKVLTDSLRSMEEDGIITRTVYPEVPPRVEYALSDLGESMRPIIQAMEQWGTEYKKNHAE